MSRTASYRSLCALRGQILSVQPMTDAPSETLFDTGSVIRKATASDAVAIEKLYRELVSNSPISVLPEHIETLEKSQTSFLIVAEKRGVVCATALLNLCADVMYRGQPFGVIENVIVTESMRARGLGSLLLAHVEQIALEHDCSKLMLLSSVSRPVAHSFFQSCGFSGDSKRAFVKYRSQFGASLIKL